MKSAEELFAKYETHYIQGNNIHDRTDYPSGYISESDFTKALAEHDREIIQIIDDMVKARKRGIVLLQSLPLQNPPQISTDEWILALTELKQKLMEKLK